MIERLPDPERSYAVLIGTSSYQSGKLAERPLPAVRNNLTDLAAVLTDHESGGFRHDHCTVLLDHADGDTVIRALFDNAKRATDTLVVYFAGHGLPGTRSKELYLTLANTNPDDALWWRGALAYDEIRRVLLDNCRAANRVVLLDCCFSGRAIPDTAGADAAGAFDIRGTYTLAAVGDNELAYAPPGDGHTAFTGELLTVLRDGVPQGPKLLTLNTVYLALDAALASRDLHRPRQNNNDTVAGLALTRNPAFSHDGDKDGPLPLSNQGGGTGNANRKPASNASSRGDRAKRPPQAPKSLTPPSRAAPIASHTLQSLHWTGMRLPYGILSVFFLSPGVGISASTLLV
ncbi:MAG: caspase family protein, partial [Pseudonocardiaceae bacterium]